MIGEVIHRFERKGLQLVAMKMMVLTDAIVAKHYEHHLDKPFFASLKDFMQSSPIIAMVWQGPQAIGVVRTLVGPTKGHEAAPGTIRGDFTIEPSHNAVHASDSTETAAAEIERFFEPAELIEYERTVAQHLYEPSR
jgi:nucleoside-diphosphate kinase